MSDVLKVAIPIGAAALLGPELLPAATAAEGTAAGAAATGALEGGTAAGLLSPVTAEGFGGANMFGSSLLGDTATTAATEAASSALPELVDPRIANGLWDGVGKVPGTIEETGMTLNNYTGGYDKLNGLERVGQRVSGLFDGNGSNITRGMKMLGGNNNQKAPSPMAAAAPMPKAPQMPSEPVQLPYGNQFIDPLQNDPYGQYMRIMRGGY